MSQPIQECSIAEATWLRKWVIVNPYNISERMEFDSVHDLAQHLFNSKELILNMAKEREALQAEVERLTKLCQATSPDGFIHIRDINAAKEGKQS